MVQGILLILGIAYLFKRPRLARLRAEDYPALAEDEFLRWKRLELASIDIVLGTAFSVSLGGWLISGALRMNRPEDIESRFGSSDSELSTAIVFQLVYFAVFLLGLLVSALYGSKAARLRRSLGIPRRLEMKSRVATPVPDTHEAVPPGESERVVCRECGVDNDPHSPCCSFCRAKLTAEPRE